MRMDLLSFGWSKRPFSTVLNDMPSLPFAAAVPKASFARPINGRKCGDDASSAVESMIVLELGKGFDRSGAIESSKQRLAIQAVSQTSMAELVRIL